MTVESGSGGDQGGLKTLSTHPPACIQKNLKLVWSLAFLNGKRVFKISVFLGTHYKDALVQVRLVLLTRSAPP